MSFVQLSPAPRQINTILALGFGLMIFAFHISESLWIMANFNANMPSGAANTDASMTLP